ncbi:hypothetical protein F511_05659 [Dorcoceras hygrometricum]|uniref:Uncharacterized protein n=1 Tax=Dorcoceras hygrometricum TaxID=472368 RepID=A0A2Z7BGX8_9LAMI|nr:hypothetical protein F511_05659 [Dorcoceras hygrometricum]
MHQEARWKVLVVEESKSKWPDSDSDESTSSSSSSDSEEEVQCLMADDIDEKLSQTFEDVKAENESLKDKSDDASCLQLDDSDSLKTELSKLITENESFRSKSNELTSENDRLNQVMSSWTKSSISLGKLHEVQKPFNDITGVGFSPGEISSSDSSTQSRLADDKLKRMSFVKANVIMTHSNRLSMMTATCLS